jgi:hypothetical protein
MKLCPFPCMEFSKYVNIFTCFHCIIVSYDLASDRNLPFMYHYYRFFGSAFIPNTLVMCKTRTAVARSCICEALLNLNATST